MTIRLTTNYSTALAELIKTNEAPLDGMEVGPWYSPEKVCQLQQEYPHLPIQFHASSLMTRYQYEFGVVNRLDQYHACTHSEWISIHIELLPIGAFLLSSRYGIHVYTPKVERNIKNFIRLVQKFKAGPRVKKAIILENLPSLPQAKYAYAADPEIITQIVRETDSGFLLDISHARIAASQLGMGIHKYLAKLPLKKARQIHISGARMKNGHLYDAHESLQDEDYAILAWVLDRTNPEVVTLEYFREIKPLREQLNNLHGMLSAYH